MVNIKHLLCVFNNSWDGICSGWGQHSAVRVGKAPENEHRRQEEHLLCHHVQSGLCLGILVHVCSIFPFCFKYFTITSTDCKESSQYLFVDEFICIFTYKLLFCKFISLKTVIWPFKWYQIVQNSSVMSGELMHFLMFYSLNMM